MDKIYLDEKGYQKYLKEIENIREKIKKNSADITEYQSDDAYGDGWHDNFAYEQAIQKENMLFHELDEKLRGLERIEIVKEKINNDKVGINSIVEVKFEGEEESEIYKITGGTKSDIKDNSQDISINSPLGKSLNGKKVNDIFTYKVDNIEMIGKIIGIK